MPVAATRSTATPAPAPLPRTRPARGVPLLIGAVVLVLVAVLLGVALGARDIAPADVLRIVLFGQQGYDADVLWVERIPRTMLGALVGAALGGSGLVMQALTRNPLADPGILGIEVGAALFVVLAIVLFDIHGLHGYFWFALAGAAVTAALVYLIGTRTASGDPTLGLVLAGAAVAACLASVTTLLVVRDEAVFASLRFWSVGQLTGRADVLGDALPFLLAGLLVAPLLGRSLNILGLGQDTAAGLGLSVGRTQLLVAAVAVLLCAAATAAAGPVAFVGLVAAHIARMLIGADHRWSLPLAMLTGAALLLLADVAGRLGPGAGEIPVGIMTALVGTPFFVWLARRRELVTL
ncbi:FecCD family ABC transporter permease [Micropruina sp.]|uniref:FecCD family ABC transporter permease n=1 Tax=Micropruina sp. TaxID=2737536 RepID=UPI0039E3E521